MKVIKKKKIHEENIQIVKVSLIIEPDIKVTDPSAIPRKIKKQTLIKHRTSYACYLSVGQVWNLFFREKKTLIKLKCTTTDIYTLKYLRSYLLCLNWQY